MSSLPQPTLTRWQPLRLGLKNLYRYDDERFVFAGGRLLLRGNNGTGKTRVLALTLPFLFDGEVRPARVEPDGDSNRRIEWHLLMDRHHERTGYAWIEFGRLENGQPRYCTLGCGMRAVEGHQGLRGRWFFVSEARIDDGIALADGAGTPLSQSQLKELLDGKGTVYDAADAYRRAVDDALFGLGERRYEALIKLLIELRRPQLSRALNEEVLSTALTDALAPLEQTVLDDVAEGYRGLERDRDELTAVENSAEAVSLFNKVHRREVAVHAGRLADAVRSVHGRYDTAQGAVRTAQDCRARAQEDLESARKRLEKAAHEREQAEGASRALQASPQMKTAAALDQLREDVQRIHRRLEADDAEAGKIAAEALILADEAVSAKNRASAARVELATLAGAAQTAGTALGIPIVEVEEPAACRRRLSEGVRSRREAARKLQQLDVATQAERARCSQADLRVRDAETLRDEALRSAEAAEDKLTKARQAFVGATKSYITSLAECRVDAEATARELAQWLEEPEGRDPLSAALAAAASGRFRSLAEERAAKSHAQELLVGRRKELVLEAERLRSGEDLDPPSPSHRDNGARSTRPGAPLWRVVDFRSGIVSSSRAGYEAALQASGLLDAWLHPDGRLEVTADGDVYLQAGGDKRGGPGLGSVLVPAIDASDPRVVALDTKMVERALTAIGSGPEDGTCWVAADGRWQNGPANGAWTKASAEYLGAGARAAARKARLTLIAREIEDIDAEAEQLGVALAVIDSATKRVQAEQDGAPDAEEVRLPWHAARGQAHRLAEARERVATRQSEAAAKAAELARVRAERDDFAADCGLVDWIERSAELALALLELDSTLRELARSITSAAERTAAADLATTRANERSTDSEKLAARAGESSREAAFHSSKLAVLEATQGTAVAELLRRLDEARLRAESAESERKAANIAEGEALRAIGRAEGEETQASTHLEELISERRARIQSLREIAAEGLLAILGEAFHAATPSDAADTRILELARSLAREIGDIPRDAAAVDRLQAEINEAFQALHRTLSSGDMLPIGDVRHGLHLVRVPFQGRDRGTVELETLLRDDASQRRQLLTANERKVIENFLLDEAAGHLHGLLHEAEKWVATVNKELESRPMSTGMALRFRWKPGDDAPEGTAEARDRLLRPSHAWSTEDREGLAAFLQRRISASREEAPTATWQEQLAIALDYRRWHRFVIDRRDHTGRWQRLTKRTHGTASGGEKAVALTMPQFAAAAAHYHASPNAPRLILLDEAFVGIDSDMRRHCLGLLAAFDLDVVMTSEREWGCYDTVPSLAIYQLASAPSGGCIAATRYVWDGRQRARDDSQS